MREVPLGNSRHEDAEGYRGRIYGQYVNARAVALAPNTLEGLSPRAADLRKLIREYFPADRDASILDLGCGHGALIHFAREAGYRNIEGVDRSPEQVAAARQLGIEGVYEGDLVEKLISSPDSSIDCVVTFDVLEHFKKTELLPFVDQVWRVLRDGGRWIIHAPNGESPFGGRMRYWDFTHEMAFTRQSLTQLLMSSGFTKVECYEETLAVAGIKRLIRWLLWKCIRGALRVWIAAETGDTARDAIFSQNLIAVALK
ncbi:MAG: class I SAM-dependent methyltransferase [Candidatus Binataceae bacterium]|nr:class I SAM-dependent methyltransferase [Candidatus Binataceae bacterium]